MKNIPVLICVHKGKEEEINKSINYLVDKKGIRSEQLFFLFSEIENAEKMRIIRGVKEKGIDNPQIVETIYDLSIKRYLEIYPVAEYVSKTIEKLNSFYKEIEKVIKKSNDEIKEDNEEKEKELGATVEHISELKGKQKELKGWKKNEFEENGKVDWTMPKLPKWKVSNLEDIDKTKNAYKKWAEDVLKSVQEKEEKIKAKAKAICGFEIVNHDHIHQKDLKNIAEIFDKLKIGLESNMEQNCEKEIARRARVPRLLKNGEQSKEQVYYGGEEKQVIIEDDVKKYYENAIRKYGERILEKYEKSLDSRITTANDKKEGIEKEKKENKQKEQRNQDYRQEFKERLEKISERISNG